MLVTDLNSMEDIVASRNDLFWEGWNVIKYTNDKNAMFHKDGVFRNGSWMKKRVFPITENGWSVPNNFGRGHGQVEK
jgi:hypothetical protein